MIKLTPAHPLASAHWIHLRGAEIPFPSWEQKSNDSHFTPRENILQPVPLHVDQAQFLVFPEWEFEDRIEDWHLLTESGAKSLDKLSVE